MIRSKLTVFAFLICTTHSYANDVHRHRESPFRSRYVGSFKAQIQVTKLNFVFVQEGAAGCYVLKKNDTHLEGEVNGTGLLSYNGQKIDRTENRVPGVDFKGHNQICISPTQQGLKLQYSLMVHDDIDGVSTFINDNFTLAAPLTANDQIQLQNGQQIQMTLTPASRAALFNSYIVNLNESIRLNIIHAIKLELPNMTATVNAQVEEVIEPQNWQISIDNQEIRMNLTNYGLKSKYRVRVGF